MAVVKEKDLWGLSAYCVLFHDSVNLRFGSSDVMLEGLSQSPSGLGGDSVCTSISWAKGKAATPSPCSLKPRSPSGAAFL